MNLTVSFKFIVLEVSRVIKAVFSLKSAFPWFLSILQRALINSPIIESDDSEDKFTISEESFFNSNIRSFIDFYVKMCSLCRSNPNKKSFMELSQYTNLKSLIRIASVNTINDIVISVMELIKSKPIDNEMQYSVSFLNDVHDFEEVLEKIRQNFSATINETSFNEDDENVRE